MKEERKSIIQRLFKGGSILFVGLVVELAISFVAKVLMARFLGKYDYGIATLGITTLAFGSAVLLLGMNNGVGRYLPRYDDDSDRKGVIISAVQVVVGASVAAAVVVGLLAEPIATHLLGEPAAATVLRVAALGLPFATLLKLSIGVIQGMQESIPKVLIRNIGQPIIRFTLIAGVIALGLGSTGIVWAYTVTFAAAALLGTYYVLTKTPAVADVDPTFRRRELVAFSAPLMMMTTMVMLLSNLDIFLISYFRSTAEVGTYNVVYPLSELLTVTLSAFSFIFMPAISELHANGREGEMERIYRVVTKWIFLMTLPLFLVILFFPETVIGLTFGAEYVEGAAALVVLSFGFFLHGVAGPNMNTLTSIGRTRIIMYDNLLAAATNVVLNIALIPRYSYLGAAVATVASYSMLNLLYSYQLYRTTGIHPLTGEILRPGAAGVVVMTALYMATTRVFQSPVYALLATVVGFVVGYGVAILGLGGVQEEEVMLVLSFEERFGVNLGPLKSVAKRLVE